MTEKSDTASEANLGHNKYEATPGEHLRHLLNIGWSPDSALIKKYIVKRGLQNEFSAHRQQREQ